MMHAWSLTKMEIHCWFNPQKESNIDLTFVFSIDTFFSLVARFANTMGWNNFCGRLKMKSEFTRFIGEFIQKKQQCHLYRGKIAFIRRTCVHGYIHQYPLVFKFLDKYQWQIGKWESCCSHICIICFLSAEFM